MAAFEKVLKINPDDLSTRFFLEESENCQWVEIFDVTGRSVYRAQVNGQSFFINGTHFRSPGVHFYQVTGRSGRLRGKMLKMN